MKKTLNDAAPGATTSVEEIRERLVATLERPDARGKNFELYGAGDRRPDWNAEFARLQPDK